MSDKTFTAKTCTPCRGGIPPLSPDQAEAFRSKNTPEWRLEDDARRIERNFAFRDFRRALDFVDGVGALAESEGHHPDIHLGWGYATISLQTKKIMGLHENDFIMAAKIDSIGETAKR